jgi:hypothetical protein
LTKTRWLAITLGLLLVALGTGVAVVLWGISVARDPAFLQRVTSPYTQVQDYAFELDHVDCDILIYGDSSAMTSDDPSTIESITGHKTCNISQTQPIVAVYGNLPVDLYLRRNHPPKYLVIQVAPEMFFQTHSLDKTNPLDPLTLILRHDRGIHTDELLLLHPQMTLRFVNYVLQDRYKPDRAGRASFREKYGRAIENYDTSRGKLTLPEPVETTCGPGKALGEPADFGWVEAARKRYAALGVKVLVIASPIPECDAQFEVYRKALDDHLDGPVTTLPIGLFNDSDRHFTSEGSAVVSDSLARRISALEAQPNRR